MKQPCKHSNRRCVISSLAKNQGTDLNPSPHCLQVKFYAGATVRPAPFTRPCYNGFALPEALLAMLLFMFILFMLYTALFSAGQYQRAGDVRLRHNDDKRFIQSFLRRQVEHTVPLTGVDDSDTQVLFRGDEHTLRFVGPLPSYQADDGLYLQELSLADDALILRHHPLTRAPGLFVEDGLASAEYITLAQPVERLELAYFGRHTADGAPAWGDAWDNPAWLPSLLRVDITLGQQDPWPTLVIALRAQAEWRPPQLVLYLE